MVSPTWVVLYACWRAFVIPVHTISNVFTLKILIMVLSMILRVVVSKSTTLKCWVTSQIKQHQPGSWAYIHTSQAVRIAGGQVPVSFSTQCTWFLNQVWPSTMWAMRNIVYPPRVRGIGTVCKLGNTYSLLKSVIDKLTSWPPELWLQTCASRNQAVMVWLQKIGDKTRASMFNHKQAKSLSDRAQCYTTSCEVQCMLHARCKITFEIACRRINLTKRALPNMMQTIYTSIWRWNKLEW